MPVFFAGKDSLSKEGKPGYKKSVGILTFHSHSVSVKRHDRKALLM